MNRAAFLPGIRTTDCTRRVRARFFLVMALVAAMAGCTAGSSREVVLFDFEDESELEEFEWKCHTLAFLSGENVTHGTKSLKLELYPSEFPGIFPRIKDNNWTPYRELRFDVYNPDRKEIPLYVRIDDRKDYPGNQDSYLGRCVLRPGANTVAIPLDSLATTGAKRKLNTGNIYRVIIFMDHPHEKVILWVDYVRLVSR